MEGSAAWFIGSQTLALDVQEFLSLAFVAPRVGAGARSAEETGERSLPAAPPAMVGAQVKQHSERKL